ncbi:aminopeptidase N [Synechococcus sp. J7-Johnson]|uniref:aminopeptidase N n=1 Tax=Synechococcus sp. J7-Johnson TaxID=2823737 RepID=UPI0020CBAF30|nr:aminopeptidase N [Synechococcus sp. J7-Johnson]MCP9840282.1 aminopeptidase N [Synechococcus sp. J7-Johnson]
MSVVRLADYRPFPYRLERTDLTVRFLGDEALVESTLLLESLAASDDARDPLVLRGEGLELLSISLDGRPLLLDEIGRDGDAYIITSTPAGPFRLSSEVRLHPRANSSLEGLYASGSMVTTQCEAEGFRRITLHPDRPDVLSLFRVRIEAERGTFPVLLSNGNCIEQGTLPALAGEEERHYVVWDDPFPKPSYLFALVAGVLEEVRDSFTTASGRKVQLRLHVEPGDAPYTGHAMTSLQRSMAWDERVYGLEYDLDEYNIVAVRHFNMGAMENKSLNIFNSKLVLADAATATDAELERIESVIAHEYFHNWTGNRITCRDWFQLSLKEGLTVFRDQCFTADLHAPSLKRIEDVAMLRNTQFREDAGPTAHPVQPDHYQAIDNFYTTTIYEKGAEVIRMLHTLLGPDTFMRGMASYVQRHDGTAATCDDFVQAMQDTAETTSDDSKTAASKFCFEQFRRWYHQAGTPRLEVQRLWDGDQGRLSLTIRQYTPPSPGQPDKLPLVIPLALGAVDQAGEPLLLQHPGETTASAEADSLDHAWGPLTRLLVIDKAEQTVVFEGFEPRSHPPALSLLRGFSAPVQLEFDRPHEELLHLLSSDGEPLARWDAGQILLSEVLLRRAAGASDEALEDGLVAAFSRILLEGTLSDGNRCALLTMPGLAELEAATAQPDPPALFLAIRALQTRFGEALADPLSDCLERCRPQWGLPWPEGVGDRQITGLVWSWRAAAGDGAVMAEAAAAVEGPSMTLARAGLRALQPLEGPERKRAMAAFYERWQARPVILDAWFSLEASAPFPDGLERVEALLAHPRYDPAAPNSVRAVLGGLVANTPVFHAADGSGYRYLADQIARLDQRNPITASRMAKVFSRWQSYAPERGERMREAMEQLATAELSANTREVLDQSLGRELRG